jgi:hypothetical protein
MVIFIKYKYIMIAYLIMSKLNGKVVNIIKALLNRIIKTNGGLAAPIICKRRLAKKNIGIINVLNILYFLYLMGIQNFVEIIYNYKDETINGNKKLLYLIDLKIFLF